MNVRGVPARIIITGDVSQASAVLPLAQDLAERLWDAHRHFVKQRIIGPNGERITAEVNRAARFARLTIEATGVELTSGLAYFELPGLPIRYDEAGKTFGFRVLYPRRITSGGDSLGPWQSSKLLVGNFGETQASLKKSRRDLVPFGFTAAAGDAGQTSVVYRTPGKYSGEMRKVVQYMIARGWPVPFEYGYYTTHGIMTCRDGSRWIIEIGRTHGIRCMRLPTTTTVTGGVDGPTTRILKEIMSGLGYLPSKKDPIAAGEWATILPASHPSIANYYLNSPYAENIGWAFSASGREAQNTCWSQPDEWRRGKRFKISLSQNATGTAPESARLELVEEGVLKGDRVNHFKFYDERVNSLVSFDLLYDSTHTPPSATDTPWYVFYAGEDEVVARYRNTYDTGSSTPVSDAPGAGVSFGGGSILIADVRRYDYGTNTSQQNPVVYVAGKTATALENTTFAGSSTVITAQVSSAPVQERRPSDGNDQLWETRVFLEWKEFSSQNRSTGHEIAGIIPHGDREAVCLYDLTSSAQSSATYNYGYKTGRTGTHIWVTGHWGDGLEKQVVSVAGAEVSQYLFDPASDGDGNACLWSTSKDSVVLPSPGAHGGLMPYQNLTPQSPTPTTESTQRLRLFGSSNQTKNGVLLFETHTDAWPSQVYTAFTDGVSTQQVLHSVPDAFERYQYASATMNGVSGADLKAINTGGYPYAATSANTAFFVGKP